MVHGSCFQRLTLRFYMTSTLLQSGFLIATSCVFGVINFTPKRTYCACTSWVYIINGECLDTRQSFTCLISTLYPTHTSHWFRSRSITSESWEIQGYNIQWSTEYCQLHRRLSGQTPTAAYSHCISHFYTWRPYFYIWFLFFSHTSTLVQLPRTCGFHIVVTVLSQSHPTFPFIQSSTLVPLRPTHSHWPPNQKLNSVYHLLWKVLCGAQLIAFAWPFTGQRQLNVQPQIGNICFSCRTQACHKTCHDEWILLPLYSTQPPMPPNRNRSV